MRRNCNRAGRYSNFCFVDSAPRGLGRVGVSHFAFPLLPRSVFDDPVATPQHPITPRDLRKRPAAPRLPQSKKSLIFVGGKCSQRVGCWLGTAGRARHPPPVGVVGCWRGSDHGGAVVGGWWYGQLGADRTGSAHGGPYRTQRYRCGRRSSVGSSALSGAAVRSHIGPVWGLVGVLPRLSWDDAGARYWD
jgi:hypothetical protein